jgi:uncharacterized protein YodC (DUF2158 family)
LAEFQPGDVVVLKSGSMRMLVESIDGESVGVLWANDGGIGRDTLPAFALKEWEDRGPREGGGGRPFGGPREGGGKPYGPREGGGKPFAPRGDKPFPAKGGPGGPKPRTGMDGKPKQKNFYRKDG